MMNGNDIADHEYEANNPQPKRTKVKYRVGDKEMEVEGSSEEVNRHTAFFFSEVVGMKNAADSPKLITANETIVENSSPTDEVEVFETVQKPQSVSSVSAPDLLTFFLQKAPKTQGDEVLTITYYYHKFGDKDKLSLQDYEAAYLKLQRAAVKMPGTLKSTVRNIVDRSNPRLLYNPDRGLFQLTLQGEQHVENMGISE